MKITCDGVCWLAIVAWMPSSLQVVVQSIMESKQLFDVSDGAAPVPWALQEMHTLGWHHADNWWTWYVLGIAKPVNMIQWTNSSTP